MTKSDLGCRQGAARKGPIKHGRDLGGKRWSLRSPRPLARPWGQRVKPAWQTVTKVTRLPVRLFENKYINYLKKPIKSSFESFMQGEPR
ncbi:hypothetical protein [Aeromonas hydrophila]|uniref:hypothetical protein n=1 Tax=Aeromonas hydrophila TaxID=644 RepID=UPI0013969EB1|nr:hypothetical protein [Aeromonas hydrophila]